MIKDAQVRKLRQLLDEGHPLCRKRRGNELLRHSPLEHADDPTDPAIDLAPAVVGLDHFNPHSLRCVNLSPCFSGSVLARKPTMARLNGRSTPIFAEA